MPAERILDGDTLKVGKDKLNKAIEQANKSEVESASAVEISDNAVEIANAAKVSADYTRTELNAVVVRETDTDAMSRQAAVDADGIDKINLKKRLDDDYNGLTGKLVKTDADILGVEQAKEFGDLVDATTVENLMKANWTPVEKSYEKTIIELLQGEVLPFVAFTSIEFVGSEIWVMYRRATDHLSDDGRIDIAKSADEGVTWMVSTLLETAGIDYRDPNTVKAPNGNIVLRYFKTIAGGSPINSVWFKAYDVASGTWSAEIASPMPSDYSGNVCCRGNAAVVNGKIQFANYTNVADEQVFVVESADNGQTWTFKSYISREIMNETSLAYMNGKVYAVMRSGIYIDNTYKDYRNRIYISVSYDEGATFTHPKAMPVWGHAPSLEVYNGRMIMTYRSLNRWDNKDGKSEVNLVMLRDTGVDSPIVNLMWATGALDLGYCDVRVKGDFTYIVYHLYTTASRKIFFIKVPNTFINGLSLLRLNDYMSNKVTYINNAGIMSVKSNVKVIQGDVAVNGDGTISKDFTIDLTGKASVVYLVDVQAVHPTGIFTARAKTYSGLTMTGMVKVDSGTFTSTVPVRWIAYVST